ncbi:cell division protein ZapA [Novosphingobium sp. GV055]|nr:cell division protein ZapA [Novosphingobium sp. GV055]PUB01369.1 cell division protein ZapA [Novosphingobium sp. GV061]PUB16943.1 cell division protein ZapA [Novosphingobium sp. GV079]PUB39966.1 cell division protein ZapA [Novosphingobium sp. GV027]
MQMTNVTLAIGGRSLTISVAAGEEAHAEMLGRMIDDRVRRLGNMATQGEARMLLFAALMLADELHEVHSRPAPVAPAEPPAPPPAPAAPPPELIARVTNLAERVENLAQKLALPLEPDAANA